MIYYEMSSIRPEDLTPFGRIALRLDQEFAALTRAGEQIAGVDLETDGGLDEGVKILNRVAAQGQSLAETMQGFALALQEARDKSEAATKLVAERAELIQERRRREDQLAERLAQIKQAIAAAGAALAGLGAAGAALGDADKRRVAAELGKLREPMDRFIAAAEAIKAEAAGGKFRRVERQAESVIDSLKASRRKIADALGS